MKEYLPLYDSMGNVAMILDDQGVPIERYDYSPFGERAIQANDFQPPSVEQIRLVDGEIWVELSEPSVEDLLEVVEAGQLRLKNTTKNVDIGFDPEYGVEEGRQARRRLVLKPANTTGEEPDLVEGNNLQLVLESGVLVDSFGNPSIGYTSDPFQWSATGETLVADTAIPELTEVCLVDNKLIVDFSEPVTTQAASTVLQVNGNPTTWASVHEGYGVELATALEAGSYTLSFGTDPLDLAAKPLAATPPIAFTTAETPVDAVLHEAPYPGEVATSTIGNTFGFHGLPLDEETGLIYARHRFFDSELGRFTQVDPLGYVDGPSAYQFAGYNPFSFWDPLGLEAAVSRSGHFVITNPETGKSRIIRHEEAKRHPSAVWFALIEEAQVSKEDAEKLITKGRIPLVKPRLGCPAGQRCISAGVPDRGIFYDVAERMAAAPICSINGFANAVERSIYRRGGDIPCPIPAATTERKETIDRAIFVLGAVPLAAQGAGYLTRPAPRLTLNIGAGENPMPGAVNIDLRRLNVDLIADATELPFRVSVFDDVVAINPYGFNPVSAEVASVMQPGSRLTVVGQPKNPFFQRFMKNTSPEELRSLGFEVIEPVGPADPRFGFGEPKTTTGHPIDSDVFVQVVLERQ